MTNQINTVWSISNFSRDKYPCWVIPDISEQLLRVETENNLDLEINWQGDNSKTCSTAQSKQLSGNGKQFADRQGLHKLPWKRLVACWKAN